jgi:hypothetical protein
MRDRQMPLAVIFSVFASVALVSVFLVLMIQPTEGSTTSGSAAPRQP